MDLEVSGAKVKPLNKKYKMGHYNTLTWPQNAGNTISEHHKFKNFPGEGARGPHPFLERPSLNSCIDIRPSFSKNKVETR